MYRGMRLLLGVQAVLSARISIDQEPLASAVDSDGSVPVLGEVQGLDSFGMPRMQAAALLAGDVWPRGAGPRYRVINAAGEEQEFDGKHVRTLEELTAAGDEVDGLYLVVPNREASRALVAEQTSGKVKLIGDLASGKLESLERDAAKDYGNHFMFLIGSGIPLSRAYLLGHEGGVLTLSDGAPVAQAAYTMNSRRTDLAALKELYETSPVAQRLLQGQNYPALAHIALVLSEGEGDELQEALQLSVTCDADAECFQTPVAEAYANLDGKTRVKYQSLLRTHRYYVRAVFANAGTSKATLREEGDGTEEILEEKNLPLELKQVQSVESLGDDAAEILSKSTLARDAGDEFRVIDAQGLEQEFDGKRLRSLDELIAAGSLIDGKYLVIPTRGARRQLQRSKDVVLQGWNTIDILEKDLGKSKPPKRLVRAYRISHDFYDPTKLTLEDGAPLAQAVLVMSAASAEEAAAEDDEQ